MCGGQTSQETKAEAIVVMQRKSRGFYSVHVFSLCRVQGKGPIDPPDARSQCLGDHQEDDSTASIQGREHRRIAPGSF